MLVSPDDRKEAVKMAVDMVKTLLTFALGSLAVLVAFFRADVFVLLHWPQKTMVMASGFMLMLSIASGIFALSRIYKRVEGRLAAPPLGNWSTEGVVAGAINIQALTGLLGIAALVCCLIFIGVPKGN